jgi:hypothetical protein
MENITHIPNKKKWLHHDEETPMDEHAFNGFLSHRVLQSI